MQKTEINRKNKIYFMLMFNICLIFLTLLLLQPKAQANNKELPYNTDRFIYLSDIPYIEDQSFAANGYSIHLDENNNNGIITLKVEDQATPFIKGVCAWGTSNLVYDLSEYEYDYFTAYIGVDISEQSNYFNTGAKFYIYTSTDGQEWGNPILTTDTMYGWSEAQFVKINIKDVNYIKLVADDNSDNWWANWYDETVYADAKLIKEDYEQDNSKVDFIKTVEEYDQIIKNKDNNLNITGEYELILLQRDFVNKVGYDVLQALAKYSDEAKNTIYWLMNDVESLRLYIVGGTPDGSHLNALKVLIQLYSEYREDLTNENVTQNNVVLKDLYRKMMISLSLTHSTTVGLWTGPKTDVNSSNPVNRYAIYKRMHQNGLLKDEIFETLTIEEMRWVMNNIIDDEEIEWLNAYSTKKGSLNPYSYITYGFGYDYWKSEYYDEANYDKWNEKYGLSDYKVSYKSGYPKLWIVFEEGAVCGGISKTGSNLWGAYGVPSSVVSQPGHAAYIYYSQNSNGDGVWNLYNDVSGWAQSGRTEVLSIRMPNGWGSGSYASNTDYVKPASYILLAQAAQNEYEKYEKAEQILLLADVYKKDNAKLYEIYRQALDAEEINFDAWYGLVNLYVADDTKTEQDYYNLAKEIATTLTYYPLPMHDLLKILQDKFTTPEYTTKFNILEEKTLTIASKATDNESIQANAVKAVANALLGGVDTDIATFSFDGENAGAIVLSSRFNDVGVRWEYSLDGKENWTETEEHILQLTEEELSSITDENDIKIHIVGASYDEANIYTIDITKSDTPTTLYNNDLENRVIGATNQMEWKLTTDTDWTSFETSEPDLSGDKTVEVRIKNTGTKLKSDSVTLNYTKDNQPETKKYIPISHLSIHSASSYQSGREPEKAIDGSNQTLWHGIFNGTDSERYIIIKLDSPTYISALEYVPRPSGSNGNLKNGSISVSMDAENWTQVKEITDLTNNNSRKMFEFESTKALYVKLQATENYTTENKTYLAAMMINLFEDKTASTLPTAEVQYDITTETNENVTATLVNPSKEITMTNNDGKDTYVFNENGEFTFEFVDKYGNNGSVTAKVDWIVKQEPTPDEDENKEPIQDTTPDEDENKEPIQEPTPNEDENKEPIQEPTPDEDENKEPIQDTTPDDDENKEPIPEIIPDDNENNDTNTNTNKENNIIEDKTIVNSTTLPKTGNPSYIRIISLGTVALLTAIYFFVKIKSVNRKINR